MDHPDRGTAPAFDRADTTCCHIAFGVDAHYFRGMGVMIASIIEHNRGRPFVFHVFAFAVADEELDRLRRIEDCHGIRVEVHLIDPSVLAGYAEFPGYTHYSAAIFTRLLIPAALRGVTDRVLYLDADMLCQGSLAALLSTDLGQSIVALVLDNGEETARNQCDRLKLRDRQYFNSGLLYINIENWIANGISEQVMRLILEHGREYMFPDQDALNIVLDGRATLLDGKWNFQFNLDNFLKRGDTRMDHARGAVIIHFTGRVKPWHDWGLHDARSLFLKYQAISPWAGIPLDGPRHYKEMRMLSQFLARQGKSGRAALWYARYLMTKFIPHNLVLNNPRRTHGRGTHV